MKKLFISILCVLFILPKICAQIPVYDKSKHYQLRSMETGPWEFYPPGWYQSWWNKDVKILWGLIKWKKVKLPGLGIHDNGPAGIGGGDKYVTRYSPNSTRRAIMLLEAKMSNKKYQELTASIKKVHDREMLDATDRLVDIVYQDYKPMFNMLNSRLQKKLIEYSNYVGMNSELTGFILEQKKIMESIDQISKSYTKNIDKQKAYVSELKNLENLLIKCDKSVKTNYFINELEKYRRHE